MCAILKLSAIHLWGHSGRGLCRKHSANFCKHSENFPQNFRTLSWRNTTYFFKFARIFRIISANFPHKPLRKWPQKWTAEINSPKIIVVRVMIFAPMAIQTPLGSLWNIRRQPGNSMNSLRSSWPRGPFSNACSTVLLQFVSSDLSVDL